MKNRLSAMLLAIMIGLGMFSTTALAMTDGSDTPTETAEPVATAAAEQPAEALTPDGNLDLVDDTTATTSKQFITVVTKSGNYFYIIIDYDDKGDQTVHFLNQVDESDLLALMDDDEAQAILDAEAAVEAQKKADEEAAALAAQTTPEPIVTETMEEMPVNMTIVFGALAAVAAGLSIWLILRSRKKKKNLDRPDPDADYQEDDSDTYEFPEDESDNEESHVN